uniref:Uncharacterized protein n=1 Tax=Plectus sambesii TaxID=2011161 RepID=A0A914VFX3_9BILA
MTSRSPDDSSGDESFRNDVLKAVGVTAGPKEAIKMRPKVDKTWILPGEKILVE